MRSCRSKQRYPSLTNFLDPFELAIIADGESMSAKGRPERELAPEREARRVVQ